MHYYHFFYISKIYASITFFIIMMIILHIAKPSLIYDNRNGGGFRQFGLGYSNKTILPIWLVTIFLAIISYLAISIFYDSTILDHYIH